MEDFLRKYVFYVGAVATTLIAVHYSRKFYIEIRDYKKNTHADERDFNQQK